MNFTCWHEQGKRSRTRKSHRSIFRLQTPQDAGRDKASRSPWERATRSESCATDRALHHRKGGCQGRGSISVQLAGRRSRAYSSMRSNLLRHSSSCLGSHRAHVLAFLSHVRRASSCRDPSCVVSDNTRLKIQDRNEPSATYRNGKTYKTK